MISTQESLGNTELKAVFHKVAECLYRHESSGTYYGLVKRSGKQFRRSLKTDDRALGKADAKDPIDRESSAVQAVACFYPPTDFANWGAPGDDGVGFGTTLQFKPAFGPRADTAEGRQALSKEISPLGFVHSNLPPILITHGDADKLVPLYQTQIFEKRAKEFGNNIKVIVKPGKDHGWAGMDKDMEVFAQWFDEHLLGKK